MKDIKKILIVALSLILLFAISCGDRPTGSTTDGGGVSGTLPSKYNGNYVSDKPISEGGSNSYWWLLIKDGSIYISQSQDNTTLPADIETDGIVVGPQFTVKDNTYTFTQDGDSYIFDFTTDTTITMKMAQDGVVDESATVNFNKK